MISLDNILIAKKDVETVWNFFNNVHSVAQCVPTMVNYEVLDDDTVVCDLRLKLGLIPLDSKATMSITERRDNRHLEARGVTEAGENLKKFGKVATETVTKLHMVLDLEEIEPQKTRISLLLHADAVGQMKRIYESIIKGQRSKLESQFVSNIGAGLDTEVDIEKSEANFSGFQKAS